MTNPIDEFIATKRFAQDWGPIEQVMYENSVEGTNFGQRKANFHYIPLSLAVRFKYVLSYNF